MAQLAQLRDGKMVDASREAEPVRQKLNAAREARRVMEPTWQSNLCYAALQQWAVYDLSETRTMRHISEVDERYRNRDLYQADVISEYRLHALGEMASDDDRPELLLQRDDNASEDVQAALNRAVGFAWDFEIRADEALAEADRLCVDLGTSAMRCRFDPTIGPVKVSNVPHKDGLPILDTNKAVVAVAEAATAGETLDYKDVHEGRCTWEPLSAFNLLTPAGITHERYFPWEGIVRPTLIAYVKAEFGDIAADLTEDNDIATSIGTRNTGGASTGQAYALGAGRDTRLRDHVWLITYYERPCSEYPKGRTMWFAGNDMKLLRVDERLPYQAPDKSYRSGIAYFHWIRVTGRFWSRGLVEALKDGQRAKNEHRTTSRELIRKGLPYVLVHKQYQEGDAQKQTDTPFEIVPFDPALGQPIPVQGMGPGPWMGEEDQQIANDIEHAAGVRASSLGDNPTNVSTYSQLALLREADAIKRRTSSRERALFISQLVEDTVYDIRTYWGEEKHIMLAGDDGQVEAETFNANTIPDFFIVKVAKGSAKPRSQAGELKKVEDIWNAALASTLAGTNPAAWVNWYRESLEAGQVQELPENPTDDHAEKAEFENHMLLQGGEMPVADYDPIEIHEPIHRRAQMQAELSGDDQGWQAVAMHVQEHEQSEMRKQEQAALMQAEQQAQTAAAAPAPVPPQPTNA